MIDWRDMRPDAAATWKTVEDTLSLGGILAYARATAAWATYDGAEAERLRATGDALTACARSIDEMRRGWRDLDRWADDGGRV